MSAALVAAAIAAAIFRIVPLACSGDRLAVAGGGVMRLVMIGEDGRATPHALGPDALAAARIPRSAFVFVAAQERDADETAIVNVPIDVTVPARTPPGDDIYLSTDRSNWSPSEIRMDRVDARHFRYTLQVHRGARIAFRVTRGSYATLERDASRALPPAHIAPGEPSAHVNVTVAAWADID